MGYLNLDALDALSVATFRQQRPYPWVDIHNTLNADSYERLRADLPDTSAFKRIVFKKSARGGVGHDRLSLHYQQGMPIGTAWEEFLAELRGPAYTTFMCRMCGIPSRQPMLFTFEWYYAWQGSRSRRIATPVASSARIFSTSIRKATGTRPGEGESSS